MFHHYQESVGYRRDHSSSQLRLHRQFLWHCTVQGDDWRKYHLYLFLFLQITKKISSTIHSYLCTLPSWLSQSTWTSGPLLAFPTKWANLFVFHKQNGTSRTYWDPSWSSKQIFRISFFQSPTFVFYTHKGHSQKTGTSLPPNIQYYIFFWADSCSHLLRTWIFNNTLGGRLHRTKWMGVRWETLSSSKVWT